MAPGDVTQRARARIPLSDFRDSVGEQKFNSLDAQREAVRGYVKSQAEESWTPARDEFADGGFSGGSLEGPPCATV